MEVVLLGRCSTPCKDQSPKRLRPAHPIDASEKCLLSGGMPGQMQGQMQQMQGQRKPLWTSCNTPASSVVGRRARRHASSADARPTRTRKPQSAAVKKDLELGRTCGPGRAPNGPADPRPGGRGRQGAAFELRTLRGSSRLRPVRADGADGPWQRRLPRPGLRAAFLPSFRLAPLAPQVQLMQGTAKEAGVPKRSHVAPDACGFGLQRRKRITTPSLHMCKRFRDVVVYVKG